MVLGFRAGLRLSVGTMGRRPAQNPHDPGRRQPGREFLSRSSLRKAGVSALLVIGSAAVALAAAELLLRVVPIPGISYHSFLFDEVTGQRFYPNTIVIYRSSRGDVVRRRVNSWGYLDAEHTLQKPPGVTRIGFFGDSFVEARQVPLDRAFYEIVESRLNSSPSGGRYECIAMAMMGYSTLQSRLECRRWAERLGLDDVVYVFCENDPGNHIPAVNRSDAVPYPVLSGDSIAVDMSFRDRYRHKTRPLHRAWQYAKSHSLVASTLESRLKLLRRRGVQIKADEGERLMTVPAERGKMPEAISPPSTWPDSLRTLAAELTERVIVGWRGEVERRGRRFEIVYIPRPTEMAKDPESQDSWAAWLFGVCREQGIPLIDPSRRLVEAERAGQEVFYDHLAPRGHELVAEEFMSFYDR
jgi:hypothetical protein